MSARQLRHKVDGRGRCPAASAHLLRGDAGADAHAHSERGHAALEEVLRRALGEDVAAGNLENGDLIREPADDVVLEGAIHLAAVRDDGGRSGRAWPQACTPRVVTKEPMPMPTRSASTPLSKGCFAWRKVKTKPPYWKVHFPWLLSATTADEVAVPGRRRAPPT